MTGNNQGSATISVTAQGQTATVPVLVWQDYQGTWRGMYRIRVCTASGTFVARQGGVRHRQTDSARDNRFNPVDVNSAERVNR